MSSPSDRGQGRNRTMLERMGFDDPDLKCPAHDQMTFALASPTFCLELIGSVANLSDEFVGGKLVSDWSANLKGGGLDDFLEIKQGRVSHDMKVDGTTDISKSCVPSVEFPINKGDGQYKVVVGFLDCMAKVPTEGCISIEYMTSKVDCKYVNDRRVDVRSDSRHHQRSFCHRASLLFSIEAKPRIENPMEVMRQLKTYREFFPSRIEVPAERTRFEYRRTKIVVNQYLLWCPTVTDQVKEVFQSQGILVATLPIP